MNPTAGGKPRLVLFDLDHTLLEGDSDVLWCEFLMQRGVLERARFAPRNEAMEREYRAGSVSSEAFSAFYVSTLAGRTAAATAPGSIAPRVPATTCARQPLFAAIPACS